MSVELGTRLGPYELLAFLGAGGMGEVYRARDLRLDRDVAIKLIAGELRSDEATRARLLREAKAAASLNHPHICTLFDVGSEGDIDYLVMEYLEGETLADRLRRGRIPQSDAIGVAIEICDALAAAHRAGFVHRDVKPRNIVLTDNGAKLLDFGIAKVTADVTLRQMSAATTATSLTQPGAVIGTLEYMAPEQLQGAAVDARSDLFAFGALFYEMMSGRRLFERRSRAETIAAILEESPVPLKSAHPETPLAISKIIGRCLAKDPRKRWGDAADLAAALREFAASALRKRPPHPHRVPKSSISPLRSLVVLPFANDTDDPSQQYLADGITESLIRSISLLGRVKVISRSSAVRFRSSDAPAVLIAQSLGVDGVVQGSVGGARDRAEVSVALIDARIGEDVWKNTYTRSLNDIHRVEWEIAETIAAEIHPKLPSAERRRIGMRHVPGREANEAYLRGRYYWNRETPDALERSFEYLSLAIQRDPDYALAHAAMANWYVSAGMNEVMPTSDAIRHARAAAVRARELDPDLAEAHACLGRIAMQEWDLQRARAEFDDASRLNPNLVEPVVWSARALSYLQLHDEAVERIERAKQLDPVSARPYVTGAAIYYMAGKYRNAVEEGRRALEFEPRLPMAFYFVGVAQLQLGLCPDAEENLTAAARESGRHAAALAALVFVHMREGRRGEALLRLEEMKERATRAETSPYYFAEAHVALGDVSKALEYLRRSFELRVPDLVGIGVDPLFRALHGHPEFDRLIQSVIVR